MLRCSGLFFASVLAAQTIIPSAHYEVKTFLGTGLRGDGGAATAALLDGPVGLAEDSDGNIYIAESNAGAIRLVKPDGTMGTFLTSSQLAVNERGSGEPKTPSPQVMFTDRDGGIVFFDAATCRIRKASKDGKLTDIAGTGSCTTGQGGPGGFGGGNNRDKVALETEITSVGGMIRDTKGRLVYSETAKHILRRIDEDGYIRTIAGTSGSSGSSGDDGLATSALLNSPRGLALDWGGTLLVADGSNCKIRAIDGDGYITTLVGTTACATSTGSYTGAATIRLSQVSDIAFDAANGMLYIAMPYAYRVIRYDYNLKRVTPFVGSGKVGLQLSDDPSLTTLNTPSAVLLRADGSLLVSSAVSYAIYSVKDNSAAVFAGRWPQSGEVFDDLLRPRGLAMAADDSLMVIDAGSGKVLRSSNDGVSVVAGATWPVGFAKGDNGPAVDATLDQPLRVGIKPSGEVYVSESAKIRYVNSSGVMKTARTALNSPAGVAFDSGGRLVYSEAGLHRVVAVDLSSNKVTVIAGTGTAGFGGDGAAATSALLNNPGDVAADSLGVVYVADRGNNRVRKIAADGTITTVVGSGMPFSFNNISGQQALDTGFGEIQGLAVDKTGNLFVAESERISKVKTDGSVEILAGLLEEADNGERSYVERVLESVDDLAVDSTGRVYASLRNQGVVLVLNPR